MTQLRVMTYNVLMGGRRGAPLDRLVRAVTPDILLVNEAPKTPFVSRWRCRRLARRWHLRYIGGGRRAGSNAILVDSEIEVERSSSQTCRTPWRTPRRGVATAQLLVGNARVGVVS